MSEIKKREGAIDIELDEQVAIGTYANLAVISHSPSEFIIDYATMMPGMPKAKVRSRIVLTPEHAKRLLGSLHENIARYEQRHGEIQINRRANEVITSLGEA